jgi:hypothetical protein
MNEDPELEKVIEDFKARQSRPGEHGRLQMFPTLSSVSEIASKRSSYAVVLLFLLLSAGVFVFACTHEFNFISCLTGLIPLAIALLLLRGLRK